MTKQLINIGTSANKGNGDPLRTAFDKINTNFTELYTLTGGTSADLRELAQDYAAPLFNHASHTNITVTYDDANNKILLTGVASAVWPVANTAGASGPTRIAIGNSAGGIAQGSATVAVGSFAGNDTQGGAAVAIGTYAGTTTQRNDAIAIGYLTGNDVQGTGAVSIGRQAGQTSQGAYSIAIGKLAGQTSQAANTIILNSTNSALNGVASQTNSFYVSPIRSATATSNVLYYNTTTKEITYAAAGSVSSLVNSTKTVSLASTGVLSLPAQGLLTNVNQIASATINRTGASTDTAAIQDAWETWYGAEYMWREIVDQDHQIGGYTWPWRNLPSWEGYPLLMNYLSSGPGAPNPPPATLPPNPALAPAGATAINAYLTYKELVSDIDIVSGNKAFSFENTGELSLPGRLVFKDAANAKIVLKYTDGYGYVVEDTSLEKAWTFNANGSLTLPPIGKISNSGYEWTFGSTGNLTLPNSAVIGRASDIEITTAETNYTNSLTTWASVRASYQAQATSLGYTSTGWPFIAWNATGTNVAGFISQLTTAWLIQQGAPTSPPTTLIFTPPISTTTYNELRTALVSVRDSYANWQALLTSVEITSGTESVTLLANGKLQVPNIIQTDPEEDLVIRTRYAVVTSPPGSGTYTNRDFVFGTNGNLTAPGNLQVNGGKLILNSGGNAYVESVDYGVNSANSAVNIFGGPYQKIKLRAGFGTQATWTLGTDGTLTFPNATVQTTAWTGSVSSLVNGAYTASLGSTGILTLPNAAVIGRASDIEITTAETNYTDGLAIWASVRASFQAQADGLGITSTGWPFIAWNATGTTAAGFLSQLSTAMAIQNSAPTSPPTPLIFQPAISAGAYYEIRDALAIVRDSYASWQALLTSVKITSGSESVTLMSNGKLIVPNIIQTDPEEDLIIRTRYAGVTSPPAGSGQLSYANRDFIFGTNGSITFPNNTVQTTAYTPVSGSWTVTTGTATYSFTVPSDGTYTMWVKGNIPNGIITWNATLSITNSNVPAIGQQYAWNYTGGGSPIILTAIPNQIKGVAGTISTDATYAGTTSNRFDFGISNTSGASQIVYYGYTKI